MSIELQVLIRCDYCTLVVDCGQDHDKALADLLLAGWTRGYRYRFGGQTGESHYCPACSKLPDLAERIRARRRAALRKQGE